MNFSKLIHGPRVWIWFALAVALVFGRSIGFDLVFCDDNKLIGDSMHFLSQWRSVIETFSLDNFRGDQPGGALYRPLEIISYVVDAHWQIPTWPYASFHFTNLLLHLLAVGVLFQFLQKFTKQRTLAFFVALFFAVHPAVTQTVGWIPARVDSLFAIFALLSFLALFHLEKKTTPGRIFLYGLTLLAAFFSKEVAIVLPAVHLLAMWWWRKKNIFFPLQKYLILTWAVVIPIWYFARRAAISIDIEGLQTGALFSVHNFESVWHNLPAVIPHFGKIFLPVSFAPYAILSDMTFVPGFVAMGVLGSLFFLWRREFDWRKLGLGGAIFLLFLLPTFIAATANESKFFVENRLYFPLIGTMLVFLELARVISQKISLRAQCAIVGAIFVAASFASWQYIGAFSNNVSYWEKVAESSPNFAAAHNSLGASYFSVGRVADATREVRKAIEIKPDKPLAHMNLGLLLRLEKKYAEAEKEFLTELKYNPFYAPAHFELGNLYEEVGKLDLAETVWKNALHFNPRFAPAAQKLKMLESR
ncbi:tetratricopeptide repeat protein [bacterium]|jgi:tetratricopeptide (TPR) repeat protein|nr:tetratricopeptide repeat protein [bacterium]MBT6832382.1 tetratricopeptide repeat protein [bacterium]MBT6995927.1 tetratricopeptide repeat protein [bacterium]MBT7772788.1 tetratricopeptide repeat protein [bacterium]